MRSLIRARTLLAVLGAAALAAGLTSVPSQATTSTVSPSVVTTQLAAIRAAHHSGYDRVVFEFRGPLPTHRSYAWVTQVIGDPSGLPVSVAGHAFLQLRFNPAYGYNPDTGKSTVPTRITFPLPNVTQTVKNGDFEAYLSVAIGLQRKTSVVRFFTLTSPSRVVVDVSTLGYSWITGHVYYLNVDRYAAGTTPYTIARARPLIPPAVARNALERLFAGPTRYELAHSLRFVRSDATGFKNLRINDGIARVQLTGGCNSHGSTYTIANEIRPTLKQFPSVRYVKIYSPSGYTERPYGSSDSIPFCLEP